MSWFSRFMIHSLQFGSTLQLHRALIRVDDHQGNYWLKALTIEDKLDLATSMLNAVQPKIQRLHQDLRQEATVHVL